MTQQGAAKKREKRGENREKKSSKGQQKNKRKTERKERKKTNTAKERRKKHERQGVSKNAGYRGTEGFRSLIDRAFGSHASFRHCERNKREEKGEAGDGETSRSKRRRTFDSPAHQLQYPCFFRHLPVAKEAHVSCLLVSGYYWLQKDLQVQAPISPPLFFLQAFVGHSVVKLFLPSEQLIFVQTKPALVHFFHDV